MLKGCSKIILMLPLFSMAVDAGEIKGSIKDGKTHEPVVGASVFLRSTVLPKEGLNALSEDGNYSFPNLKAGTYTVTADFAGAKAESTVTITDEQTESVALTVNMMAAQAATYKIETTGTRLPTAPARAISPITTVDSREIQAVGSTRIEDVVNQLPQTANAQGSTSSNGSDGTAQVNLRGLGSQRTLVLVDGRRLGPGNATPPEIPVGDLNFIPTALVERVDVLTGGSSAVYGADAVGGVVNFIMKKDFQGVQFDLGWSGFEHVQQQTDIQKLINATAAATAVNSPFNGSSYVVPGNVWNLMGPSASLIIGANTPDGKGNVTAYGTYRKDFGVLQSDRDFSECVLSVTGPQSPFICAGSGTMSPASVNGNVIDFQNGGQTARAANQFDVFNFGPLNYFQRPDERWTLGGFAHYKLADWAEVYSQGMFMNDVSNYQIAPGGIFGGGGLFTLNCDNPLMSAQQATAIGCPSQAPGTTILNNDIRKRNVEGGGRQGFFTHNAFRYVFGVKGDLGPDWHYDIYHQYMQTDLLDQENGYFINSNIQNALIVRNDPRVGSPTFGTPVCQSVIDGTDPACVPYNIWDPRPGTPGASAITPAALAYLNGNSIQGGRNTERVVNANIAGNLGAYGVKSPLACDGVAIDVGGEFRYQTLNVFADHELATGQLNGRGGVTPQVDAWFDVFEGFVEGRIPLVQDLTAMKLLQVEGAYRFSQYSLNKQTHTFKVGGIWEFMDNMRVRGSYQRSVREPSLTELFLPDSVQLDGATDPCALAGSGLAPTDPTVVACNAAYSPSLPGFNALNVLPNVANQYNGLLGGNAGLNPEISDSIALGVFLQPSFIPGLQLSADYFYIFVNQDIGLIGADLILQNCLTDALAGNAATSKYCPLVHRDNTGGVGSPAYGSIWLTPGGFVNDTNQNLGSQQTDGIDVFAGYDWDSKTLGGSDWGRVYLSANGTWVNRLVTVVIPGTPSYDCSGLYGAVCLQPTPAWRHKMRATWDTWFGLSLSAQWRFISAVNDDATSTNPVLANPGSVNVNTQTLGSRHYLDVVASYSPIDMFTFRFGVNNVIDTDPPLSSNRKVTIPGGGNGNTVPQVYDALGRFFFMNMTAKF